MNMNLRQAKKLNTMKQFEEIKKEILERAHNARACTIQYKRAYQSENLETLCNVIKDNFWWCCRNNVLDGELIDKYKKIFSDNKIYHNVSIKSGFLLASGNSTVQAYGNSTVEAYGNSTVEAYDNSTVQAYDNSTVEAYDNSYINCRSTIECVLKDNSIVRKWDTNTIQYVSDNLKFEKKY